MGEGVRKEESSLPPDYVSLAQLQERWLQKQQEMKLKQNQEQEKSERDARAQKENTQNQSGRAKMAGGFVRDSGVFHDKGKGKEILTSGPGNGRANDMKREISRGRTRDFKRAAAVEEKAKELGAGDQCEGAEISGMQRPNLRGGLRGNGENQGSRRVNDLDSEKKVKNERDDGKNRREKGRERGSNEGYWEMSKGLKEFGPVVSKFNKLELEKRADDEVSIISSEMRSLSVRDKNRNSKGSNNAKEDIFEEECSNGDKMKPEIEKVDHDVLAKESAKIGKNRGGMKGHNRSRNFDQERRQTVPKISAEKDGESSNNKILAIEIEKEDHEILHEESAKIVGNDRAVKGYQKNKNQRRGFGRKRRYSGPKVSIEDDRIEGEGSDGNEVALEIEKKIEHEALVEETAKPGEKRWVRKANQINENQKKNFGKQKRCSRPVISADEDRIEGECSNGKTVELEIEKKVDNVKGYQRKEDIIEGEGSNGNKVAQEIEKKVDNVKGYPRKEDIIEGEGSNGNKVALEIEKKEAHEVLAWGSAKKGENRGVVKGYRRNEKSRRGFVWGNGYRRREISYSPRKMNSVENVKGYRRNEKSRSGFVWGNGYRRREISYSPREMNSVENGMVWVKKEEKLGA